MFAAWMIFIALASAHRQALAQPAAETTGTELVSLQAMFAIAQ
jgi:hypothetical protein